MITFLLTIICLILIIAAGLAAIAIVLDYIGVFDKKQENKDQTTIKKTSYAQQKKRERETNH